MSHEFFPHEQKQSGSDGIVKRKAMAFTFSPEAKASFQLGFLFTCAVAISTGTVFVWNIKTNVEAACEEIRGIRTEMNSSSKRLDRLWWDYEQRTGIKEKP